MLCFNDENPRPHGFVRVDVESVIRACEETIRWIDKDRRRRKRASVRKIFASKKNAWRRYGRWLRAEPPTRQKAIDAYNNDVSFIPQWFKDDNLYSEQYDTCQDVLKMAKVSTRPVMWVSDYAVRRIRL